MRGTSRPAVPASRRSARPPRYAPAGATPHKAAQIANAPRCARRSPPPKSRAYTSPRPRAGRCSRRWRAPRPAAGLRFSHAGARYAGTERPTGAGRSRPRARSAGRPRCAMRRSPRHTPRPRCGNSRYRSPESAQALPSSTLGSSFFSAGAACGNSARATAPSTPLMKDAASSASYTLASSTASLIATRTGTSST